MTLPSGTEIVEIATEVERVAPVSAASLLGRRRERSRIGFYLAWLVIALLAISGILGALITPHNPFAINLELRNLPPGSAAPEGIPYLLGTDVLGRDLLSRIMIGARITLAVGLVSVTVSGAVGIVLGLLAGYHGGKIGTLIMRFVDLQMGIPSLLISLMLLFALGASAVNVVLVFSFTRWPIYARLTRGLVLQIREQLYVDALIALGSDDRRLLFKHILPNAITPLIVVASFELSALVLAESSISFLGLGVQPPDISWGVLLAQGREYLTLQWWLVTFPGVAILLTSLAFNVVAVRAYEGAGGPGRAAKAGAV